MCARAFGQHINGGRDLAVVAGRTVRVTFHQWPMAPAHDPIVESPPCFAIRLAQDRVLDSCVRSCAFARGNPAAVNTLVFWRVMTSSFDHTLQRIAQCLPKVPSTVSSSLVQVLAALGQNGIKEAAYPIQ